MAIKNWKVAVLLVSFSNSTATHRRTDEFYRKMFINTGAGGLPDYWESVSFGMIDFTGSELFSWRTFNGTDKDFRDQAAGKDRNVRCKLLMDVFTNVDFRKFNSVIIIPDGDVADVGAAGPNGVFKFNNTTYTHGIPAVLSNIDTLGKDVAHANFFAHEMGHTFGLGHSYGIEDGLGSGWVQPGEYNDPWDVLGSTNPYGSTYMFSTPIFTQAGITLHAPNLKKMGWLDDVRIKKMSTTADGFASGTPDVSVVLEPLYSMDTPNGFPAFQIEFTDADTGTAQSYWLELRLNTGWDRGAPEPMLLIRRVISGNTYLLVADNTTKRYGWKQGEVFIDERNNVRIEIESLSFSPNAIAKLKVGSFITKPVALGTLGKDIQAAGMALTNLDNQARPEIAVFAVENLAGENQGFCSTSLNINADGKPAGLLGAKQIIPGWGHWENQKGDITFVNAKGTVRPDAAILYVDNPDGGNEAFLRFGTDMLQTGSATWDAKGTAMPRKMAGRTMGAALAQARMDGNSTPDLVAVFSELPANGRPRLYYRFAKNFKSTGVPETDWSGAIEIPRFNEYFLSGIGAAVADLRRINKRDLVVFALDRTDGNSRGYYTIGRGLDANGIVTEGWTQWFSIPAVFGPDCKDVSIELSNEFHSQNYFSMLVFSAEKSSSSGNCDGFLRFVRRLKM